MHRVFYVNVQDSSIRCVWIFMTSRVPAFQMQHAVFFFLLHSIFHIGVLLFPAIVTWFLNSGVWTWPSHGLWHWATRNWRRLIVSFFLFFSLLLSSTWLPEARVRLFSNFWIFHVENNKGRRTSLCWSLQPRHTSSSSPSSSSSHAHAQRVQSPRACRMRLHWTRLMFGPGGGLVVGEMFLTSLGTAEARKGTFLVIDCYVYFCFFVFFY